MSNTTVDHCFTPFPEHKDLVTHFYLKALNISLALIASFVNLFVFVAILTVPNLREKASIIFILSLTFADLLIAFVDLPLIIVVIDEVGIKDLLVHVRLEWSIFYISWTTGDASCLSLLVASLDRLIYVSYPFRYEGIVTGKRAFICIMLIWILSPILFCLAWLNYSNLFAYHLFVNVLLFIVLASYMSVHLRMIYVVRSLI